MAKDKDDSESVFGNEPLSADPDATPLDLPVYRAKKIGTGTAAFSQKHSANRKPLEYPNEDHYSVANIAIPADQDPASLLDRVVRHVEVRHRNRSDGAVVSTAAIVDENLYTSHLGDAPIIVLIHNPADGKVEAHQVTRDHVLNNEEERKAMPDQSKLNPPSGTGKVWRYGKRDVSHDQGIMVSRAMGDGEYDLIRNPESHSLNLKPYLDKGMNVYVAVGSDGIIEHATLKDIERMIEKTIADAKSSTGQMPTLEEIATHLVMRRHENGVFSEYRASDDSTVVVQEVKRAPEPSPQPGKKTVKLITLADGHGYDPYHGYDRILAEKVTEEIPQFFEKPHLIRDAVMSRKTGEN